MTTPTKNPMNKKLSDYQVDVIVSAPAISRGYPWECACGEVGRCIALLRAPVIAVSVGSIL